MNIPNSVKIGKEKKTPCTCLKFQHSLQTPEGDELLLTGQPDKHSEENTYHPHPLHPHWLHDQAGQVYNP